MVDKLRAEGYAIRFVGELVQHGWRYAEHLSLLVAALSQEPSDDLAAEIRSTIEGATQSGPSPLPLTAANQREMYEDCFEIANRIRRAGYPVGTPWDLYGDGYDYTSLMDDLLLWLRDMDDGLCLEGVVRALTDIRVRGRAFGPLVDVYERLPRGSRARWATGNALGYVAAKGDGLQLVGMIGRTADGQDRSELLMGIPRLRREIPVDTLRSTLGLALGDDSAIVRRNALIIVSRMRLTGLASEVRDRSTVEPDPEIRQVAARTWARFQR